MAAGKINLQKASGGITAITGVDGASNTNLVLPESGTVSSVDTSVTNNAIARYDGTTGKLQNSSVVIDDNGNVGIGTGSNINAKLDVVGSVRQYNPGTSANSVMNHVNDAKNWYVGLRGDSSNAYSIADETRQRFLLDVAGNTLHLSPNGGLGYGTGSGGTVTQITSKSTYVTLNKPTGQIITSNSALGAGMVASFILNNSLLSGNDNVEVIVGGAGASGAYKVDCTYCVNGACNIEIKNLDLISRSDNVVINFTLIKGAIS